MAQACCHQTRPSLTFTRWLGARPHPSGYAGSGGVSSHYVTLAAGEGCYGVDKGGVAVTYSTITWDRKITTLNCVCVRR